MEVLFVLIYMLVFWRVKIFLSENIYAPLSFSNNFIDLGLMFFIGFFVVLIRRFFYFGVNGESLSGSFNDIKRKVLFNYFWHVLAASCGVYYVVCIADEDYFDGGVREFGFSIYVFCLTLISVQFIELCLKKIKQKE